MKSKWNDLLYGKFKRPKKWMLEKDLSFSSDLTKEDIKKFKDAKVDVKITATGKITVPEGYITDLASVPRACWAFIAPFDVARPAVIHDILYERINARSPFLTKKEFAEMRKLVLDNNFEHLSMGMSNDYLSAIDYGATFLRLGSKIFGARD